jgi:NADH:ubiquinone reductase (H+-translocating)
VLVGWVLYGLVLGLFTQFVIDAATRFFGPEVPERKNDSGLRKRIVILGGGFAGMKAAECLEQKLQKGPTVSITLVSENNALRLFRGRCQL